MINLVKLSDSHLRLVNQPLNPNCEAIITLPIRNEAEYLQKTLVSLTHQVDVGNKPVNPESYEIIVFANNCVDQSAKIARAWQRKNRKIFIHIIEADLCAENSNIGFVRRWLMNEAFLRLQQNRRKSGVILTTDADTVAAPNWLAANLAEIKNGADAVGGRILIAAGELSGMDKNARRFHLYDTAYRLLAAEIEARLDYISHDFLPRHHQHFNGSFAVTTEAFERAGGVPETRFLEDVAFYHALLRCDARIRHSPLVRVKTSARRKGRTEAGLSTQINEWALMGERSDSFRVEGAAALENRIRLRKKLRDLWLKSRRFNITQNDISYCAGRMSIDESFLIDKLHSVSTFGIFYEKVMSEQEKAERARNIQLETVEKALFNLRIIAEKVRREREPVVINQSFSQISSR